MSRQLVLQHELYWTYSPKKMFWTKKILLIFGLESNCIFFSHTECTLIDQTKTSKIARIILNFVFMQNYKNLHVNLSLL